MRIPHAARWATTAVLVGFPAAVAASCGGSGASSVFNHGGGEDASSSDVSTSDVSLLGNGDTGTGEGGPHGPCTPKTCKTAGYDCGQNTDGCGGVIDCGTCTAPETCGGGGFSKCGTSGTGPDGGPKCTPATCTSLGFDCGAAGDGCGGLLQCGSCTSPEICGASSPNVCGGMSCTGLCKQQAACDGGVPTTITGRVVAGTLPTYGTPDPVPGVLVYVPNGPLQPFTTGVQCGCPEASGDPLVWTTTAVDGTFTLPNVPVGSNIPIVIQLGRWRREVEFNVTTPCMSQAVGDIRMPRNHTDGLNNQADIPLTALSTGSVDAMECVLLKMGIDEAEFTNDKGTGRVNLFMGNGADVTGGASPEANLTGTLAALEKYDVVIFPCWGNPVDKPATDQQNMVEYTSAGGRMFATHYSYTWLYKNNPFDKTATWDPDTQYNSTTGDIDTSFPRGATFGQWMELVKAAAGTPPSFTIQSPRQDFKNPVAPSLRYIYSNNNGDYPLHYTFDTPWQGPGGTPSDAGADAGGGTCGRVIYSDFHVAGNSNGTFPTECTAGAMTAQEKALEYTIWDLSQCLGSNVPMCTPKTCAQQNIQCGPAGDGCGNVIQCGSCTSPQTCGGGGTPSHCGVNEGGICTPATCASLGFNCGAAGDGCGGLLQCGTCSGTMTCGGGGNANQCGGGSGSQ